VLFRKESKNTASSRAVAKHNKENGMMEPQHPEAFFLWEWWSENLSQPASLN